MMGVVGRSIGEAHGRIGDGGGAEIDERMDGLRQDPERTRDDAGEKFRGREEGAGRQRNERHCLLAGCHAFPPCPGLSDSRFPRSRKPGIDQILQLQGEEDTRILIISSPKGERSTLAGTNRQRQKSPIGLREEVNRMKKLVKIAAAAALAVVAGVASANAAPIRFGMAPEPYPPFAS